MEPVETSLRKIAFIGNHLPRQCGIATFTTDLSQAVAGQLTGSECYVLAVNDKAEGYDYPPVVRFELNEQDLTSFHRAADFLNVNHVDLVCLQHEFGIFGGKSGSHILALLRELQMPVVTTLHTILRNPNPEQRRVFDEITRLSDRLVVMSQSGSDFLRDIYHVPGEKIDIIPHGIPDVPFVDPNFYKDQYNVAGKQVLLTFGLLSPNKGIEYVIEALPAVLRRHPDVVYMILGATHPNVKRNEGEAYREHLQRLAVEKGIADHVIFHNRFVTLQELVEFIGSADIYLTPYLNHEQIVSGTLAYTLGAGKAIVSTPYWYAEELLAEGRGALVPFRDPEAIADRINALLDNEPERHAMRKRAYQYGREMVWSRVARQYIESFERARRGRAENQQTAYPVQAIGNNPYELPRLKLDHLERMTDGTGLLQHASYTIPNYREGYTTDDNARGLLLMTLLEDSDELASAEVDRLTTRYMAFLAHAYNPATGRFRNFMSYDRRWLETTGSEDSHARALWALGTVLGRSSNENLRSLAGQLFDQALPAALDFESPRAWAFTLVGIHEYLHRYSGDRFVQNTGRTLAERLFALYSANSSPAWPWYETSLTYDNAKLPHALLVSGARFNRPEMTEAGLCSLAWLAEVQRSSSGNFTPVGNQGFYPKDGERARFDQQPIEAQSMVSACLEAYRQTRERRWLVEAQKAFYWFLGRNDLGLALYDPETGGCCDGLEVDRVNQNQGAESTLSFLLSLIEMSRVLPMAGTRLDVAIPEPAKLSIRQR